MPFTILYVEEPDCPQPVEIWLILQAACFSAPEMIY